ILREVLQHLRIVPTTAPSTAWPARLPLATGAGGGGRAPARPGTVWKIPTSHFVRRRGSGLAGGNSSGPAGPRHLARLVPLLAQGPTDRTGVHASEIVGHE